MCFSRSHKIASIEANGFERFKQMPQSKLIVLEPGCGEFCLEAILFGAWVWLIVFEAILFKHLDVAIVVRG